LFTVTIQIDLLELLCILFNDQCQGSEAVDTLLLVRQLLANVSRYALELLPIIEYDHLHLLGMVVLHVNFDLLLRLLVVEVALRFAFLELFARLLFCRLGGWCFYLLLTFSTLAIVKLLGLPFSSHFEVV
jgi:hypothetical protein